jgi:protocatechuate 3,4-dioxygenase alpha subunit
VSTRPLTPSQTVGPFFHDCMLRDDARCDVIGAGGALPSIRIEGRVLDGDGVGVPDAVIEVWRADAHAEFARVGTDEGGRFAFTTIRPAAVPFDDTSTQAPHLSLAIFARGLLNHLFTRLYFADDPTLGSDPILGLVPEARRRTLLARPRPGAATPRVYELDVVLQGEHETVFFDFHRRGA